MAGLCGRREGVLRYAVWLRSTNQSYWPLPIYRLTVDIYGGGMPTDGLKAAGGAGRSGCKRSPSFKQLGMDRAGGQRSRCTIGPPFARARSSRRREDCQLIDTLRDDRDTILPRSMRRRRYEQILSNLVVSVKAAWHVDSRAGIEFRDRLQE